MPIYEDSKASAAFFILFEIITTLYLHSLVLSVVFQTYIQASTDVDALSMENQEETLRLSFAVLQTADGTVPHRMVRKSLQFLRPHYPEIKINALMNIYNQHNILEEPYDYPRYRQQIECVLNASIRARPTRTFFSWTVENVATSVAVLNLVFILLLSSSWELAWFDSIRFPVGYTLTLLGGLELAIRADPLHMFSFTPITKLDPFFDGMALIAAGVSLQGLWYIQYRLEFLMIGRAIDVIRIMRIQRIFRDVVRRSGDILPALVGPLSLLVVANHLFVCLGMALWGGSIEVGNYGDLITELYDLNNFNSYLEVRTRVHIGLAWIVFGV